MDVCVCVCVVAARSRSIQGLERSAAASRGLPLHVWPARRASLSVRAAAVPRDQIWTKRRLNSCGVLGHS